MEKTARARWFYCNSSKRFSLFFLPTFIYILYFNSLYDQSTLKVHGRFFSRVIKDLRDALGLGNVFSVGLDIDEDISSKVGSTSVLNKLMVNIKGHF